MSPDEDRDSPYCPCCKSCGCPGCCDYYCKCCEGVFMFDLAEPDIDYRAECPTTPTAKQDIDKEE